MKESTYRSFSHTLFDQARFGIIIVSIDGRILDVNPYFCSMLGYDREEVLIRTAYNLLHPDDLKNDPPDIPLIEKGETIVKERRVQKKSGEYLLVESHVQKLETDRVLILIHDISKREQAVIASEEKYRRIVETSLEGIWQIDAERKTSFVNKRMAEMLGYSEAEMIGEPVEHFMFSEDLPDHQKKMTNRMKGKGDFYERRFRQKNGRVCWTKVAATSLKDEKGNFSGSFGMFTDITEIKQAESDLRKSEEKYKQIAEKTSDVIWMMNNQMQYTYVSPSIYRQRGFSPEEFITLKPESIYTPDSFKKVVEIYTMGITLGKQGKLPPDYTVTAELQHLCKDGSIRDSEVLISPVFDSQGNLIGGHGVSRDITERKLTDGKFRLLADFQSNLLRANQLQEVHDLVVNTIYHLVRDGIVFTTNIDQHTDSGRIVSFTGLDIPRNRLTQALGLDPLEMTFYMKDITDEELRLYRSGKFEELHNGLHAVATRRFPKGITQAVQGLLNIKKVYTIGFVYHELHLGGLVILARGDLSSYAGIIEMIVSQAAVSMNRIKAERSLKEVEERFRMAFQTSPDAVNINEMETGRYIDVNEGFTAVTGYRREDVIGRSSNEIHIWNNPVDRAQLVSILRKEGKVNNFEAVFRFKDGTTHTGLMSAAIIQLYGVPHIISISRDIEELKQAERDIVHAKEAAEEASRLKTSFLNNISHEVRTPMNAILGFTDLLQSEELEKTEKERFYGIINSNARQLLSIIDDVLEVSRMDSGRIPYNPGMLSLQDLVEDIHISMMEMVVKKGLRFIYTFDDAGGSDQIIADREKIRQVISGLIGNAVKFTSSGTVSFGYTKRENEVEFYVRDTGIGIPVEEQSRIFERFYQVSRETIRGVRGTGLGLSISQGLAEVMGGSIRVESTVGSGSVFYLKVPFQEPGFTPLHSEHEKPFTMEDLTILVAEDEDNNFELLEILLGKKAKKLIRAANGKEVLRILENIKPDLVLMDLKMPVMDGYEATRRAKVIHPDLQVIALTAYTQPEEERHAMEAGCSAFISKPIRNQDLVEAIRRCFRN